MPTDTLAMLMTEHLRATVDDNLPLLASLINADCASLSSVENGYGGGEDIRRITMGFADDRLREFFDENHAEIPLPNRFESPVERATTTCGRVCLNGQLQSDESPGFHALVDDKLFAPVFVRDLDGQLTHLMFCGIKFMSERIPVVRDVWYSRFTKTNLIAGWRDVLELLLGNDDLAPLKGAIDCLDRASHSVTEAELMPLLHDCLHNHFGVDNFGVLLNNADGQEPTETRFDGFSHSLDVGRLSAISDSEFRTRPCSQIELASLTDHTWDYHMMLGQHKALIRMATSMPELPLLQSVLLTIFLEEFAVVYSDRIRHSAQEATT
jgi:hypothetical protein